MEKFVPARGFTVVALVVSDSIRLTRCSRSIRHPAIHQAPCNERNGPKDLFDFQIHKLNANAVIQLQPRKNPFCPRSLYRVRSMQLKTNSVSSPNPIYSDRKAFRLRGVPPAPVLQLTLAPSCREYIVGRTATYCSKGLVRVPHQVRKTDKPTVSNSLARMLTPTCSSARFSTKSWLKNCCRSVRFRL